MATHVITITSTKEQPLPLTISDDEGHRASTTIGDHDLMTDFQVGDIIRWKVKDGSDITSIDAINVVPLIPPDANGPTQGRPYTLFRIPPGNDDMTMKVWSTEIDMPGEAPPSVPGSKHVTSFPESYTITFTVDGKQYTEDPKLRIKQ